jgi:phage terminase large subunit-like protein
VADDQPPPCGFEFDGRACRSRGDHFCQARARHVRAFFCELLTHTKGDWNRKPFVPSGFQQRRVLSPLFGTVIWDDWRGRYVRRYRILYLSVARKNGKSELLAGCVLYLLCADGEAGAEVYGLALDSGQAGLVYHIAQRMVHNSPVLRARLAVIRGAQRIADEASGSFFQVVAGDAEGNLGENPSGAYIDELLTQPDRDLFDAVKTGMGTRSQPVLMLATTAENDPSGFAATEREWSEQVAEDPSLEPDRLVVIYRASEDADWTRPATWRQANPALGDFLEVRTLAAECRVAQRNPTALRAFKQYRLNQPVSKVGRAIDMSAWDDSAGPVPAAALPGLLTGRQCFAGLDLATTQDLAAYALVFPADEGDGVDVLWRHFCPARKLDELSRRTGGQAAVWAARGELVLTDSIVTDYEAIRSQLNADKATYRIAEVAFDPWNAVQLATELADDGWAMIPFSQSARAMTAATAELLRLVAGGLLHHGGTGLVRWQAGNAVTRTDGAGNVKLDRQRSADKIDGIVAAVMGLDRALRRRQAAPDYAAAGF